jgi:hypothetical protein
MWVKPTEEHRKLPCKRKRDDLKGDAQKAPLRSGPAPYVTFDEPTPLEVWMSGPESLKEVYHDELADLWSANDQMTKVVKMLAGKVHDDKLKALFEKSVVGINEHTKTIKSLLEAGGGEVAKEHCKGMEGLVKEA